MPEFIMGTLVGAFIATCVLTIWSVLNQRFMDGGIKMNDNEFMQQKAQAVREKIKGAASVFGILYDHDNPDHQLVAAYSLALNEWALGKAAIAKAEGE